jgi:hypothetical protein
VCRSKKDHWIKNIITTGCTKITGKKLLNEQRVPEKRGSNYANWLTGY